MPNIKRTLKEKNNILAVHFDAGFYFERGIRSHKKGCLDKAIKYFKRASQLEPTNIDYLTHLSMSYTEIGAFEESNQLLKYILDMDSKQLDCYYYLANNYAHLGDFDHAEQYVLLYLQESDAKDDLLLEEAEDLLDFICYELDRTPKDLDIEHKLIGKHEKARHCLEEGKFIEATKCLEEMVEEYPHFLAAQNNLSLAYYYMGHFEKAMRVIDKILKKDPANLHALCNLAVFYCHKGEEEKVSQLMNGLKKVHPFHLEHHYKLATTLGILGEDERAYELFSILIKRGYEQDNSLLHYMAVASYNTERVELASKYWRKLEALDSKNEIPKYYLELLQNNKIKESGKRLPYHYQLPFDVQFKSKEWYSAGNGNIAEEILKDPLVRSSLLWSLRHGDKDTKLQVIQSFQYIKDEEIEEALRQVIMDTEEEDYVKKVAIFVLRQIGAASPYQAHLHGEYVNIDGDVVDDQFPAWMAQWQEVIHCLRQGMEGNYDIIEHQKAQAIWTRFLRRCYPNIPKIRKAEGWAAAIEYLIAQHMKKGVTKKEIAERYGISVSTLSKNIHLIENKLL